VNFGSRSPVVYPDCLVTECGIATFHRNLYLFRMPLKAIDFFCGAGGMSYGLARSGVKILAGIDCDPTCKATYEHNNKPARFLERDIAMLHPIELATELGVERNDDDLILVGCSPCQFWSKINTDKTKSQKSAFLLREFERFVDWFNPGFVVIENVPGLLTKKRQTILPQFKNFLESNGYAFAHAVINANRYGVPQKRKRYLLIATRLLEKIELPKGRKNPRLIVRNFLGVKNGFRRISAGHKDKTQFLHTTAKLSANNLRRMQTTPKNGGTRASWKDDPDLQIEAYEGKDEIFRDVYARMYWDKPAPTITTRFNSFSNGRFGHPTQNRAISLREGATLQTFPKSYVFKATNEFTIARQIGNAVPPALAKRLGCHLKKIRTQNAC
jgi:DNA (cytosine-5)-methyltransferase 1